MLNGLNTNLGTSAGITVTDVLGKSLQGSNYVGAQLLGEIGVQVMRLAELLPSLPTLCPVMLSRCHNTMGSG